MKRKELVKRIYGGKLEAIRKFLPMEEDGKQNAICLKCMIIIGITRCW